MDREYFINYWIKSMLKDILRCAKKGYKNNARDYASNLQGMLFYMHSIGDISDETYNKVHNLKYLIIDRYNIY